MSLSYDELLRQQSDLVDAIRSIYNNFKKDGAARKLTVEYHDERLKKLENNWTAFEFNDTRLSLLQQDKTGNYYENQVYDKLKAIYMEAKGMITFSKQQLGIKLKEEEQKLRAQLQKQKEEEDKEEAEFEQFREARETNHTEGESTSQGYDTRTMEMLNEQKSNVKAFERTICNLDIDQLTEKWQLEDKLRTISQRWECVDKLHWRLDNVISDMRVQEHNYNKLERMFEYTKTLINKKIWARNHQESTAPKIELPVFSGNYSQWTTFKDLFMETVHLNTFISGAQKMQHLKSKLRGEAERLVQHLTISADNYETCWNILQQRYDNIRLLFTYHANELLNQPNIQLATASNIKRMHDTTMENLNAISNLHVKTEDWDPLLVHILLQKLDAETKQSYIESLKNSREIPKLCDFICFLENKFMALESSGKPSRSNMDKHQNLEKPYTPFNKGYNKPNQPHTSKFHSSKAFYNSIIKCPKCTKQHGLYNCKQFLDLAANERLTTANKLGVCKNCLFNHNGNKCTSTKRCKQCNKAHNTLLHDSLASENESGNSKGGHQVNTHLRNDFQKEVLLATAQIQVKSSSGSFLTLRALLDQGSQVTLITEDAAQRLNIKRHKLDAIISGIGAAPTNKCKGIIQLSCKALNSDYTFVTEALIMNTLTSKLPNKSFNKKEFQHLEHISLADPDFNISGNIDILLGADIYSEILLEGLIKTKQSNIIAQQTQLGWIICGKYKTFHCHVTINNLEDIAKFWEQEDIQDDIQQVEENQDRCEKYYMDTTTRLEDGRYQVRLPLRPTIQAELGTSKPQAVAQFKHLERRMNNNIEFATDYKNFMQEYLQLGHMKKVEINNAQLQYFLPHHGIVRANAVTTKLRVVFNASAKTSTKKSLNDLMESGPNLQADLQTILLQWRQYRYVLTADIEKMYRYIAMHPDDQKLQKIVWRESPQEPLHEYQLCTVTYGTKAAPFLALRTLKQLALDEGDRYPKAKPILQNNFFVDDAMFGSCTISEAQQIRDQLIHLLRSGGFNLRKWASNEPRLVEDLPEELRNPLNFKFTETQTSKTLGLGWNPKNDEFILSPVLNSKKSLTSTKRQILSEISSQFDPLGWIAPVTIKTKILFQQVWSQNMEWDDKVPEDLEKEWSTLRSELINMQEFKITRWLGFDKQNKSYELHAFCDASEKAYACVVYSVLRNDDDRKHINIIAAKTKVAPKRKQQSLPRLELCGAQLLSKLVHKIKQGLNMPNIKVTAWTDSMVVLGWINGDINRWKTYVANRVKAITTIIPSSNWRHIKSEHNPADCASRGLLPSQLHNYKLWWEGPDCLRNNSPPPTWNQKINTDKEIKVHSVIQHRSENNIITQIINRHSTILKAKQVIGWVLRFITMARDSQTRGSAPNKLTITEMREAYTSIIKQVQAESYGIEINNLVTKGTVNSNSAILKLNPFVDKHGILRVGGRLQHSYLQEEAKHPAIIPQNSRLSQLLIDEAHLLTLHGGARLTLATLRQRFWIIGGNKTIKKHLRQCVTCCRHKGQNQTQIMGNLPSARATPSPPFHQLGVDFTGSVEVKLNKGRGVRTSKGYIAVFICMATKAVHLELVSDLSSPTFILALKRLIARRGCPKHIYSDNGTNFVGADRELKKQLSQLTQTMQMGHKDIKELGIEWHFNAPSWPNAGGLWEAAVKSMKYHLKRVIGLQKLTYEEFATLLAQIEACLNSRPLCPLTEDIDDLECLTPGHFLIGRPLISLPQENHMNYPDNLQRRWRLTEKMNQHFWNKWSTEYLQQLQTRCKWNKKSTNLQVGDMVIIKEDCLPPNKWNMGRVSEIHPGRDELVRVVTLKTKDGTLKRPINKLVLLPVAREDQINKNNKTNEPNRSTSLPENKNTTQNKRSRRGKSNLLGVFLTLITLINPTKQTDDLVNLYPFQSERAVYFDNIGKLQSIHDSWKIVTYFNMTSYWQGVSNIQKLVSHVEASCEKFTYKTICESITTELKQEVQELKHNNYLLSPNQETIAKRVTRGLIDGVGYIANSLFGVLDSRFAEKYKRDIELLHQNEHHLLNLIRNQTTIIEAQNNILKRNEQAMNKQFQLTEQHLSYTNQYMNRIQKNIQEDENMIYFNMLAMSANIILTKLRFIQDMLLKIATNIHHGHVDTQLLSTEQMQRELNIISGQLPKHLTLPVDNVQEQLINIYKMLEVKWVILENYYIIEITLPLANDNWFQLYKPIPIPIMKRNNTSLLMKTESDYIAINIRKEMYMTLSERDVSMCTKIEPSNLVCRINKPTYNMRNSKVPCEISTLINSPTKNCIYIKDSCTNKWIELHKQNTWIYFCCNECSLRVICKENMIAKTTKNAGIIEAASGCIIKHEEATFYTQQVYQSSININMDLHVPTADPGDINNITSQQMQLPTQVRPKLDLSNVNDLQEKLNQLKGQSKIEENWSSLSSHDVHQFVVSYTTLGLSVAVIVAAGCIYMHWKRNHKVSAITPATKAPAQQSIEMRTFHNAAANRPNSRSSNASTQPSFNI